MAKEQRNKRVKQREYECRSCPNRQKRFKGQKEINFSGLEPGEFQKVLSRLVWHVDFLVFTHCMNLKLLSPCQTFGLPGLNSYLPMYRQDYYHSWTHHIAASQCSTKIFTQQRRHLWRSFTISSGPAALKPKCFPVSSSSAPNRFRTNAIYLYCKKAHIPVIIS